MSDLARKNWGHTQEITVDMWSSNIRRYFTCIVEFDAFAAASLGGILSLPAATFSYQLNATYISSVQLKFLWALKCDQNTDAKLMIIIQNLLLVVVLDGSSLSAIQ